MRCLKDRRRKEYQKWFPSVKFDPSSPDPCVTATREGDKRNNWEMTQGCKACLQSRACCIISRKRTVRWVWLKFSNIQRYNYSVRIVFEKGFARLESRNIESFPELASMWYTNSAYVSYCIPYLWKLLKDKLYTWVFEIMSALLPYCCSNIPKNLIHWVIHYGQRVFVMSMPWYGKSLFSFRQHSYSDILFLTLGRQITTKH